MNICALRLIIVGHDPASANHFLSAIDDLSRITSCLVLPGFLMDTLLNIKLLENKNVSPAWYLVTSGVG